MDTIDYQSLSDTYLSSTLPNISFATTDEVVTIAITSSSGVTLLSTNNYTYQGTGTLYDIRSVVEQYLADNLLPFDTITLTISGIGSIDIRVIYCSLHTTGDTATLLRSQFLTTRSHALSSRFTQSLYYFATKGEDITRYLSITYEDTVTGIITTENTAVTQSKATSTGIFSIQIDPLTEARHMDEHGKALSITAHVGARAFTFFYTDATLDIHLCLRNAFLCTEHLELFGITKRTTSEEHSEAFIQRQFSLYDRQFSEIFEFETAPLPYDEACFLRELLLSHKITIAQGSYTSDADMLPILITDSSLSPTSDHSKLSTLSFTYRFPHDTPLL